MARYIVQARIRQIINCSTTHKANPEKLRAFLIKHHEEIDGLQLKWATNEHEGRSNLQNSFKILDENSQERANQLVAKFFIKVMPAES